MGAQKLKKRLIRRTGANQDDGKRGRWRGATEYRSEGAKTEGEPGRKMTKELLGMETDGGEEDQKNIRIHQTAVEPN